VPRSIHGCNKRLQTFYTKKIKKRVLTFYYLNVFSKFSTGKITQITFPDCSNIGNVLTINGNGILRMPVMEISIVIFYLLI